MKRMHVLAAVTLAFPAVITAQQSAAPNARPANPVTESIRDIAGTYGGWLAAAFDSIPAGRYGFWPTPVQQSVGYIAQHLEGANYALCDRISGITHPTGPKDALADTVKALWPKDTLVARLRASLRFCEDAFTRVDDSKMGDPVLARRPGATETAPRARALGLFVTDLAEHYSQIAGYMRLMGMVPPSALRRPSR